MLSHNCLVIIGFKKTNGPDGRPFVVHVLEGRDRVALSYFKDGTEYYEEIHFDTLKYIKLIKDLFCF
jgi:hypothetical protein